MKSIKWKYMFVTSMLCLLPIVFGLILWDKLPPQIAIHFNMNNAPDN